jgi:hypothetical protein
MLQVSTDTGGPTLERQHWMFYVIRYLSDIGRQVMYYERHTLNWTVDDARDFATTLIDTEDDVIFCTIWLNGVEQSII